MITALYVAGKLELEPFSQRNIPGPRVSALDIQIIPIGLYIPLLSKDLS